MSGGAARVARDPEVGGSAVLFDLEVGEGLDPARASLLRVALQSALGGGPTIRRVAVYGIARGHAVVRLMTRSGWIPVLIAPSEWRDADALASRLHTALTH